MSETIEEMADEIMKEMVEFGTKSIIPHGFMTPEQVRDLLIDIHDGVSIIVAKDHYDAVIEELTDLKESMRIEETEECHWTYDETHEAWETSCGRMYHITTGTPKENGMDFCAYCGKRLESV